MRNPLYLMEIKKTTKIRRRIRNIRKWGRKGG
jgi:hypothetical protein